MKEKFEEFINEHFKEMPEGSKIAAMMFYAKGWDDSKKEK
jgi:hypothetical protein